MPRDCGLIVSRVARKQYSIATMPSSVDRLHHGDAGEVEMTQRGSAATRIQSIERGRRNRSAIYKLQKAARRLGALHHSLKGTRIRRMSELSVAVAHGKVSGVAFSVESEETLRKLRLWEQGDEEMHTREALEARYQNRSHPGVWYWLNVWWAMAMTEVDAHLHSGMPKHAYVTLYVGVCKLLLEEDEEWDYEEAVRIVEEAWECDSHGHAHLSQSMFNDSLFEVRCADALRSGERHFSCATAARASPCVARTPVVHPPHVTL